MTKEERGWAYVLREQLRAILAACPGLKEELDKGTFAYARDTQRMLDIARSKTWGEAAQEYRCGIDTMRRKLLQLSHFVYAHHFRAWLSGRPEMLKCIIEKVDLNLWPYFGNDFRRGLKKILVGPDEQSLEQHLARFGIRPDAASQLMIVLLEQYQRAEAAHARIADLERRHQKALLILRGRAEITFDHLSTSLELSGKRIEGLGFSDRTYNCLKKSGILTVQELIEKPAISLMQIRNFGQKSLQEVQAKLAQFGLYLAADEQSSGADETVGND